MVNRNSTRKFRPRPPAYFRETAESLRGFFTRTWPLQPILRSLFHIYRKNIPLEMSFTNKISAAPLLDMKKLKLPARMARRYMSKYKYMDMVFFPVFMQFICFRMQFLHILLLSFAFGDSIVEVVDYYCSKDCSCSYSYIRLHLRPKGRVTDTGLCRDQKHRDRRPSTTAAT
jgi:hypothetical protein